MRFGTLGFAHLPGRRKERIGSPKRYDCFDGEKDQEAKNRGVKTGSWFGLYDSADMYRP